jgi:chromosome segregation ATPase
MARSFVLLCGLTTCLALLSEAGAQNLPTAAYTVLTAKQQALLAQRKALLHDLAGYADKVRAYSARRQQTAMTIAQMNTLVGPWGKSAQDQRKQRQAQLRFEVDCLRREWEQLEGQRQDLARKLKQVNDALVRVQTAMAALKAAPPPPE